MERTIRNVTQHTCKHCGRSYWSADKKAGWCDDCRAANRAARALRKKRGQENAGQLPLVLE